MDIQAHHVTQAVRHEHGVSSFHHRLLDIALHQTEILQALRNHLASRNMIVAVRQTRLQGLNRGHVGLQDNLVNLLLTGIELAAHRGGTGNVRTVVAMGFSPHVGHHHAAFLERIAMVMVMQRLPVDRHNRREGHPAVVTQGNAFHRTGNLVFVSPRFAHLHRGSMHLVGNIHRDFDFGQFFLALDGTLVGNSLDQFHRLAVFQLGYRYRKPFAHLLGNLHIVRCHEMHPPTTQSRLMQQIAQFLYRSGIRDAHFGRHVGHRRQMPHPDDVVHRQVIGIKVILVSIQIDYPVHVRLLQTEEIQEIAILPERISIASVIARHFGIARKENQPALQALPQLGTTSGINLFIKHNLLLIGLQKQALTLANILIAR